MDRFSDRELEHMLEDSENLEVNEEGEIVPRGSSKSSGIKLKDHTFY